MLIMGYDAGEPKDLGDVARAVCPNCANDVYFRLLEARKWFRLFLVPVAPGSATYAVACPACRYAIDLDRAQVDLARGLLDATAAWRAGRIDKAVYRQQVDVFWAALGGRRLRGPGSPPSTEP
jgi:hypothetical protein